MRKYFFIAILATSACLSPSDPNSKFLGRYEFGNNGYIELKQNNVCEFADRSGQSECFYEIKENILQITLRSGRELMPMAYDANDRCFYAYCLSDPKRKGQPQ